MSAPGIGRLLIGERSQPLTQHGRPIAGLSTAIEAADAASKPSGSALTCDHT